MRVLSVSNFDEFGKIMGDQAVLGSQARNFLFRGQANSNWKLESTLERLIARSIRSGAKVTSRSEFESEHFKLFRKSIRGRRGVNPAKLEKLELWALGQHFGLATPLLDWSMSPYIALFFAFSSKESTTVSDSNSEAFRSVWCLNKTLIDQNQESSLSSIGMDLNDSRSNDGITIIGTGQSHFEQNKLEFVIPDIDENQRLIVQSGLFTHCTSANCIEDWMKKSLPNLNDALIRIDIPECSSRRRSILKSLDLMNINYASLFPDIAGACSHVNSVSEDYF